MCVAFAFYALQSAQHRPALRDRFPILNRSWLIESSSSIAIKRSLDRMGVPLRSTVLLTDVPEPLVPFLRVPQYFLIARSQVGYSMSYEVLTTQVKAYSPEEYGRRRALSERILQDCDERALHDVLAESPATMMLAVKPDSRCMAVIRRSPEVRWVVRLANQSEVFVEANGS
jgi:hypothetical protein